MNELTLSILVFTASYLTNAFYITVLYHRGLAHRSVLLRPWVIQLIAWTGNWVTGIDAKAWVCMHRLHHRHSDQELDPHSPVQYGVFGVAWAQLKSYENIIRLLKRGDKQLTQLTADIPFGVSFLNRQKIWTLPYLLHLTLAGVIVLFTHSYWVGLAYYLGIMGHPVQGWMVNSLAHQYGYKNHDNGDNSTNNTLVALLVFGEGYQNNHHAFPDRAKFSERAFEVDLGHGLCLLGQALGMLKIRKEVPLS